MGHLLFFGFTLLAVSFEVNDRVIHNPAEREGFEPPDPEGSTVFETAPFDRSGISPC